MRHPRPTHSAIARASGIQPNPYKMAMMTTCHLIATKGMWQGSNCENHVFVSSHASVSCFARRCARTACAALHCAVVCRWTQLQPLCHACMERASPRLSRPCIAPSINMMGFCSVSVPASLTCARVLVVGIAAPTWYWLADLINQHDEQSRLVRLCVPRVCAEVVEHCLDMMTAG